MSLSRLVSGSDGDAIIIVAKNGYSHLKSAVCDQDQELTIRCILRVVSELSKRCPRVVGSCELWEKRGTGGPTDQWTDTASFREMQGHIERVTVNQSKYVQAHLWLY